MFDIEKLIRLVKNNPEIYDYSAKEFNNKKHVDEVWEKIADEMQTQTSVCTGKWLVLRNSYSRELRNENDAILHPRRRRRRKWYLANDMEFMRNFLNVRQQKKKNIDSLKLAEANDYSFIGDETCASFEENKYLASETEEEDVKIYTNPLESTAFEATQQLEASVPVNKIEESQTVYSYPEGNPLERNGLEDQNMTFFRSILPDVLKLSKRRQRLFKQDVLSNLNKSLDEQEVET